MKPDKNLPALLCLAIAAFLILPNTARAQTQAPVPSVISYQGRMQANGTNFSGAGRFKFALVSPGTNTTRQATATAVVTSGFITSVNVIDGGFGYTNAPAVSVTDSTGSGAVLTAHLGAGGVVTSITVNSPGGGYSPAPAISIAPPPASFVYGTFWSNDGTSSAGSEPASFVGVAVQQGLFNVFLGDTNLANMQPVPPSVFLQADARLRIWFSDGVSPFTQLSPDQRLGSVGYANYSAMSGTAGTALSVPASNVNGTVSISQLPPTLVTNGQTGVNLAGAFTGNAGGLTNLNVESLVVTRSNTFVSGWGPSFYGETTAPAGLTNPISLAVGSSFSVAAKPDGTVVAWGYGGDGETNVPPLLSGVVAVAAGYAHAMALKANGTVVAWGGNSNGQTNVPATLTNAIAISCGQFHSIALRSNGTLLAWGDNSYGETNIPSAAITASGVTAISAGLAHNLALRGDGIVVAWGANYGGQTNVPATLSNVVAISAGDAHNLALKSDGTVVAWGDNTTGQTNVPAGLSNVVAVTALYDSSFALKANGTVVGWGNNGNDQVTTAAMLDGVLSMAQGSSSSHGLAVRRLAHSPVAMLDGNNTFNGTVQFNGMLLGKIGVNTRTPQQAVHILVPAGQGEGIEIDSSQYGHSPAIYLNHTSGGGHNYRIASYGNGGYGAFIVRDDTIGWDRLTIDGSGNLTYDPSNVGGNGTINLGNLYLSGTGDLSLAGAGNFSVGAGIRAELGSAKKFSLGGTGTFEIDAPGIVGGRFFVGNNGYLGMGTTNPQAPIHLITSAGFTTLRLQSTQTPGFGRIEFFSNPQGDGGEWRPGFIQSTDNGNFTGGIAFCVNGTGVGNKIATNEVMRIVNGRVGIGTNNPSTLLQVGGATCNGTAWANASDRALKENFQPVDAEAMLAHVTALPISRWNYKHQPGEEHVGPMAQDFHAAFGTGADDKHISTLDAEGVALAAIQGLNHKVEQLKTENAALREKANRVDELEARLARLEKTLGQR